ncbi:hypothetical protein WH50_25060 [Pokkaliibacter plantistimulans]|uniref:diguanylate cyclase n=2 Tax=Pokkaliibacter plantistimulans TaxID=1635171 RepID=A0ABX5LT23_9GAMM|nr:hypothetical protein WH50_25060 [Pokkaliibacter plantistimulans]
MTTKELRQHNGFPPSDQEGPQFMFEACLPSRLQQRSTLLVQLMALLCLLLSCRASLAFTPDTTSDKVALAPYLHFIADPEGKLTLDAIRQATAQNQFDSDGVPPQQGYDTRPLWITFSLANPDMQMRTWWLQISPPYIQTADLYLVDEHGQVQHFRNGAGVAIADRPEPRAAILLPLQLAAQGYYQVYVRLQSSNQRMQLTLWQPNAYSRHEVHQQFSYGLFFGLLLTMALYNLYLFSITRNRAQGWYSLYVVAFVLYQAAISGYAYEYLWPAQPWLGTKSNNLFGAIAILAMLMFSHSFLHLRQLAPRFRYTLLAAAALPLIVIAGFILTPGAFYPAWIPQLLSASVVVLVPLCIIAGILAWRRGLRLARLYLLAWASAAAGTLVYIGFLLGYLPDSWLIQQSIRIGVVLEVLVLAAALGERIRTLQEECDLAQRDAEQARQTLKERLEVKLAERTQAMRDVNASLMRESHTDALTGLFNRRHLDQYWSMRRISVHTDTCPSVLILLDLDHFKRINDTYGHDTGDRILRKLGKLLGNPPGNKRLQAIRWGGEEFLLIAENTSVEEAQRLCAALQQRLLPLGQPDVEHLTASMGIAPISRETSLDTVLKAADIALYRAKSNGRNRIEVALHLEQLS